MKFTAKHAKAIADAMGNMTLATITDMGCLEAYTALVGFSKGLEAGVYLDVPIGSWVESIKAVRCITDWGSRKPRTGSKQEKYKGTQMTDTLVLSKPRRSPVLGKPHIYRHFGRWVCRLPIETGALRGFGDGPVDAYHSLRERYAAWHAGNL